MGIPKTTGHRRSEIQTGYPGTRTAERDYAATWGWHNGSCIGRIRITGIAVEIRLIPNPFADRTDSTEYEDS